MVRNQQTFWFDMLQFVPTQDVRLVESILRIDALDPAIANNAGWQTLNQSTLRAYGDYEKFFGTTIYTNVAGGWLTLNFTGS